MAAARISDSAHIVVSRDLLATELAGELVILDPRSGVYYSLEDVGLRIWQLLQTPSTIPDIRDTLIDEFDVEPVRCEQDIRALVAKLSSSGLVEITEER